MHTHTPPPLTNAHTNGRVRSAPREGAAHTVRNAVVGTFKDGVPRKPHHDIADEDWVYACAACFLSLGVPLLLPVFFVASPSCTHTLMEAVPRN